MKLARVTLTGVDESVSARDLRDLSQRFPFVEWGVLHSEAREGKLPRYPSRRWRELLCREADKYDMLIAAHLCGSVAFEADVDLLVVKHYNRVQLNGCDWRQVHRFVAEVNAIAPGQGGRVIGQARSPGEFQDFRAMDIVPLFDVSGGRGVGPAEWPVVKTGLAGFAGGLGEHNLKTLLTHFTKQDHSCRFWVDMETSLRDPRDDHSWFSLERAARILMIAEPFVTAHSIYL
jgi:hypothetical protein